MDEHGPALIYDLATLGIDARELFTDDTDLTPRWVLWLVEWLPDTSALWASIRGGIEHRGWTADRHLAAGMVDTLQGANWQRAEGRGQRPKPVPRPGQKRVRTVAELKEQGW